ncbi:hypothetical protein Fmac_029484 [Flemingia macrophylla]|uniref:Brf1 TBP-binding domain-containing protein n=1 Tax=Flemingia macrophylla TaxID=520843 RepID=A0ABD1LAI3_9FABA
MNQRQRLQGELKGCISKDLLCEHRNSGVPDFALGLCEECYKDFSFLNFSKMVSGANAEHEGTKDGKYDDSHREDELETFSDIDDEDIDVYLHGEKGKHIKKIPWEIENRVYLEEQAAKEAATAASKKAFDSNFENCSEDLLATRELAASANEAVAKSRKETRRKRAHEAKRSGPAQSAVEAFGQMSNKKRNKSR